MRLALILMALALFACNAKGIMYLTSGSDAYGKGLSYPGYKDPPAISGFVASDRTSQLAPVFLGATLYRPEFANISSINRPYYNQFIDSGWLFSRPPVSYPTWSALGSSYDSYVPAVREFVQPAWKPGAANYQIPALQEFVEDDWEPPELSREDYPGIDKFLESEEDVPKRHLL
ncbi:MAG: hypothetical protein LUO89_15590 [Methanothrix sp.]|jgi:hypothetical protein|nr:hypothetical protein [Methanothrix sp.]